MFEIGHSRVHSCTFIPTFHQPKDQNIIYADIAGLLDTSGDLIELMNFLICKMVLNKAKSIKFIIAITKNQIYDIRGDPVIQTMRSILDMCSGSYEDLIKAIQPVIT